MRVEGNSSSRSFHSVESVRWHRVAVEIAEVGTFEGLASLAQEQIEDVVGGLSAHQAHAVRLALTGRGPLHRELLRPGALSELEDALREKLVARVPPVLLEAIKDGSQPEIDLEQVASAGGLAAEVLSAAQAMGQMTLLDELYAEDELAKLETALRRAGLGATRQRAPHLLEAATARALELLLEPSGPAREADE